MDYGKWQGGPNFIKIKRGSNGRHGGVGDGQGRKKYGSAGTKRFRFNPNPTRCSSTNCMIAAQAKIDSTNHIRAVKMIPSGFKGA